MPYNNDDYYIPEYNSSRLKSRRRSNRRTLVPPTSFRPHPASASRSAIPFEEIFRFTPAAYGTTLFVGAASAGITNYFSTVYPTAFRLRGSQLNSVESYNSIRGSAPGYRDSEKTTAFYKFLSKAPSGVVILDGLSSASPEILEDFIAILQGGVFTDKAGQHPPLRIPRLRLFINVGSDVQSQEHLNADQLKDELRHLQGDSGRRVVPDILLESAHEIVRFEPLRLNPERLLRVASEALGSPAPKRLVEATTIFELTNSDIFKYAGAALSVTELEGKTVMSADGREERVLEHLSAQHYRAFSQNLDGYFGQPEAISAIKTGIAAKLSRNSPKPVTMLCVGPPGVGKTELAKRLGAAVPKFLRLDGNTINHASEIIGTAVAPGEFAKLVKGVPTVVLIDEFEKLDTDSIKSLLQFVDEGRIKDRYRQEDWVLRDALVILTSNILTDPDITESEARELLENHPHIPPEFVDRIDIIVPFRHFEVDLKMKIAKTLSAAENFQLTPEALERVIDADSVRQIEKNIHREIAEQKMLQLEAKLR